MVADVDQDAADVVALDAALDDPDALRQRVHADVEAGRERLRFLVATADGEQETADRAATARHRMNVLFNVMRGGVFDAGYAVEREAVRRFVQHHNAPVAQAHADWFDALPETLAVGALRTAAEDGGPQLRRLVGQYLPLHFSRRHGDPSRPWNHFSIRVRDADGGVRRGFEGNWRDIFQNWEALGRSFPEYLEGMVALFVNASTADGYNPYRVTDRGIDWEVEEPDDPWARTSATGRPPDRLPRPATRPAPAPTTPAGWRRCWTKRRFSYANVPYRIAPYAEVVRDPQDTVADDGGRGDPDRRARRGSGG